MEAQVTGVLAQTFGILRVTAHNGGANPGRTGSQTEAAPYAGAAEAGASSRKAP